MIPRTGPNFDLTTAQPVVRPSITYALDAERGRIVGKTDTLDAVGQAVYLMLNIERYEHPIYSWNYAAELRKLIGRPIPLVVPELERLICEALGQDDRITGVDGFEFEIKGRKVLATFTVHTIFGNLSTQKEVDI